MEVDSRIKLEKAKHKGFGSLNRFWTNYKSLNCSDLAFIYAKRHRSKGQVSNEPFEIYTSVLGP